MELVVSVSTFELLLQGGYGGDHGGVDVVQPRAQSLLVVERLERLQSGVVAPCCCRYSEGGQGGRSTRRGGGKVV